MAQIFGGGDAGNISIKEGLTFSSRLPVLGLTLGGTATASRGNCREERESATKTVAASEPTSLAEAVAVVFPFFMGETLAVGISVEPPFETTRVQGAMVGGGWADT